VESFGPYTLLEKIAAGGMAEIYKAKMKGAGGFERTVALKRLKREHLANAELVQMLMDEAKITVRLTHSNIAQVWNLENFADEWALVLEFVDGVDLFQMERALEKHERRLGLEEAVHIVKEVLSALDFAHRLADEDGQAIGLIHCDVSPSNVMVNHSGEVKLIDFGVARAANLVLEGPSGGKIRYRSPEQTRGDEFDLRADLYSVGIVLWELLAGERIYEGLSLEEIIERVSSGDVPPIETVRDDLPEGLITVVHRALHADRRYRYPHAAAFLRALEDLEHGRDPARCRRVLAEIVRAVTIPRRAAARRASQKLKVAEERSLEDVLDTELEHGKRP
jgi:eukaryotic-like serine/threonine-protein kinase